MGMSRKYRKEYLCWRGIIERCSNVKNKDFKNYGGRGISYDKKWECFLNFFDEMGEAPSKEMSIDRIDVNGNYEKSNCRWATRVIQENNKRNSIKISINKNEMTIKQISEKYGLHKDTIRQRFKNDWDFENLISNPNKKRKKQSRNKCH